MMFLTIDHVNRDGAQRRREREAMGYGFYRQIVKTGFPADLQVLCFNCNCGRERNNGLCPHLMSVAA